MVKKCNKEVLVQLALKHAFGEEMQSASNEGAYFVIPSQLNGIDSPNPNRVLKCLEECKRPGANKSFKRKSLKSFWSVFFDLNAGGCLKA